MKTFRTRQTVLAQPMTQDEYRKYRGWEAAGANGAEEGYHVISKGVSVWVLEAEFEAKFEEVLPPLHHPV